MANSETEIKPQQTAVDFNDTKIAFARKSDTELKKTAWLFRFMNNAWLVNTGSVIGLWLNKTGINIFDPIVRRTFFWQFCGGTSLSDCKSTIDHLVENNAFTVLDFGVEGKIKEEEFDETLEENLRAIRFASANRGVPVISIKVTALASNDLLEKKQSGYPFDANEKLAFERVKQRLEKLFKAANENNIAVYVDAEETWLQDPVDEMAIEMMEMYNRHKVVVYKTYQMYRKDKLEDLKTDHRRAVEKGYVLGAKIVRGAYMEKERKRAEDMGYPSPIQDTKEDTDRDFNAAITYCVDHYNEIASCDATHNLVSNQLQADLISERGLPKNHPHLNFCQLYGMSDNITFNLAAAGYNAGKILPYGPVKEVIPYLIRRAQENTAVIGDMSREMSIIVKEMERRGLK